MGETRSRSLKKKHEDEGSVLVVTVIIIVFILIVAVPLLFRLSAQYRTTEKFYRSILALNLAEAGIERAIWELKHGLVSPWEITYTENGIIRRTTFSDFPEGAAAGDIDIIIESHASSSSPTVVESTGKVPWTGSRTIDKSVRVVLEKEQHSIFSFGIFADNGIELGSSADIDSYDSNAGLYDENNRGYNGHLLTNSNSANSIYLGNNAKVYGSAGAGIGADHEALDSVINVSAGYLEKAKYILPDTFLLTSVSPPLQLLLSIKGDYYYNNPTEIGLISSGGSGVYTSFTINQGTVRIDGDVSLFVQGDFTMNQGTTLEVAENSNLTLYLGEGFVQWQYTAVNNKTKDPANLLILGTDLFDSEMVWNSDTDLYGAIYVPRAEVRYNSNSQLYGAIVCKKLNFTSNSRIHYDEALKQMDLIKGGLPDVIVKSWQEKR